MPRLVQAGTVIVNQRGLSIEVVVHGGCDHTHRQVFPGAMLASIPGVDREIVRAPLFVEEPPAPKAPNRLVVHSHERIDHEIGKDGELILTAEYAGDEDR